MTGAGLKKCIPTTSAGRVVAAAHSTTGSDDVVVARMAPGRHTSSSAANTPRFTARSSATASITRSRSASSSSAVVALIRATAASRSVSVNRPRVTAFSIEWWTFASAAAMDFDERPCSSTSRPPRASTSAIPTAMVPVPTTPHAVGRAQIRRRRGGGGRCLGVVHHLVGIGGGVGVEAPAALAAQQAGGDHLLEQRRRGVQAVARLVVHGVQDLVGGVQADEVHQRQGPHRVAAAQGHRRVQVLAHDVVRLEHADRVVEVAEQQCVGDEARPVTDDHGRLADGGREGGDVLDDLGLGDHGADHLDQLHHRCGVEEVHSHHPAGPGGLHAQCGDRQRRGVGGDHRVGPAHGIESAQHRGLQLQAFGNHLDDEVGVGQVLERGGRGDPCEQGLLLGGVQLAPVHRTAGRDLQVAAPTRGRDRVGLHADDVETVAGEHLRDAGAHRPEPDHADRRELARHVPTTFRRTGTGPCPGRDVPTAPTRAPGCPAPYPTATGRPHAPSSTPAPAATGGRSAGHGRSWTASPAA